MITIEFSREPQDPKNVEAEFQIGSFSNLSEFIGAYDDRVEALKNREGGTYREAVANTAGIIIPNIDLLLLDLPDTDVDSTITDQLKDKKKELKTLIHDAVTEANKSNKELPPPPREISQAEIDSIRAKVFEIKEIVDQLSHVTALFDSFDTQFDKAK